MYFDPKMTLDEYEDFKLLDEINIGYDVEGDDVDKFESTFVSKYDHECFDIPATRTVEKKLRETSSKAFTDFNLPI